MLEIGETVALAEQYLPVLHHQDGGARLGRGVVRRGDGVEVGGNLSASDAGREKRSENQG